MTDEEVREVTHIVFDEMRLAFDQQNVLMVELRQVIERVLAIVERHELELLHGRDAAGP